MKPEEIAALERLCPEAAAVEKSRVKHKNCPVGSMHYERYRREYLQSLECYLPAIAACIVRLGEDGMRMAMECGEATGHLKFLRTVCDMSEIPADTLAEIDKLLNRKERGG